MGKSKGEQLARGLVNRPMARVVATADWRSVNAEKIRGCIAVAGDHGGAVRFGYTRDGGAYAVGVYGLGEPYTAYMRPGDNVEDFLDDLVQAYVSLESQPRLPGT